MTLLRRRVLRNLFIAVLLAASSLYGGASLIAGKAAEARGKAVEPTLMWMNFYGLNSTLDGKPVPVGARITAYDTQGVECGEFIVDVVGEYGVMAVYGDDLTTPEDEGASPGEAISFRINDLPARTLGPDNTHWTATGDLKRVELAAGQASSPATPGPNTPTPASTPSGGATTTPAPSSSPGAATATPAPQTPAATITPLPAASPTGAAATPTRAGSTPAAGTATARPVDSTATAPSGSQPSPTRPSLASTPPADSPTPDVLAVLGMASATPSGGRPDAAQPTPTPAPSGQTRVPVVGPGTPATAPTSAPSAQTDVTTPQVGTDAGGLVVGMGAVIVLVTALVWVRRRFLS